MQKDPEIEHGQCYCSQVCSRNSITIQTQFTPRPGSSMNFKYVHCNLSNGPKCYETIFIDPWDAFINKYIPSFPQQFGLKANSLLNK